MDDAVGKDLLSPIGNGTITAEDDDTDFAIETYMPKVIKEILICKVSGFEVRLITCDDGFGNLFCISNSNIFVHIL
jgi:hypothetical protein